MSTEIITLDTTIQTALEKAKINIVELERSTTAACAAMSAIIDIKDDETDQKANAVIVKVNATFKKAVDLRKEVTGPMDEAKKVLMGFEKQIETDLGVLSAKRNAYAAIKLTEERDRQAKIEAAKKAEQAKIDNKALIETLILNAIENAKVAAFAYIANCFRGLSLENFEKTEASLRVKPKFKQSYYDEAVAKLIPGVEVTTFDKANEMYSTAIQAVLNEYIAKLPDKKKQLEELSIEEQAVLNKKFEEDQAKKAEELKREQEKKLSDIESEKESERLSAEFTAQAQIQSVEEQKNVRKSYKGEFLTSQGLVNALAYYLENGEDDERLKKALQFVADYCAKEGFKDDGFKIIENIIAVNK